MGRDAGLRHAGFFDDPLQEFNHPVYQWVVAPFGVDAGWYVILCRFRVGIVLVNINLSCPGTVYFGYVYNMSGLESFLDESDFAN